MRGEVTGRKPIETDAVEPLGVSIKQAAQMTGESEWTVKEKLRLGLYKAKKSGRRTIIIFASIKTHWASLPEAKFQPSRRTSSEAA